LKAIEKLRQYVEGPVKILATGFFGKDGNASF